MDCVSGMILTKEGMEKGYLIYSNGRVVERGKVSPPIRPKVRGYIIPRPINSHTHIGDAFIRKKVKNLPRDIEKLVAPPHGLKHVLLEKADRDEIICGMKEKLREMEKTGISAFCDFREGGKEGVNILKKVLEEFNLKGIILSRPKSLEFDENEVLDLLMISDGIGLSSVSDWDYEEIKSIASLAKEKGKLFAIHASERVREDIDKILDLKPDFLIHMNKANQEDLEKVKEEDIPIVVCPRSNEFFGLKPNLELFRKVGIELSLGTDNAMISTPDVYEEMVWIKRNFGGFSIEELLRMITYNPGKIFDVKFPEFVENEPADFVVLDTKSLKPILVSVSEADRP